MHKGSPHKTVALSMAAPRPRGRVIACRDSCLAGAPRRRVALRALLGLVGQGSRRSWVHMAAQGSWEGHQDGSFSMTAETFASFEANFASQANPIPVTYEHPVKDFGMPIPAAGWVHELRTGDDGGLWGLVEWTDKAADMIEAGEYRYCSIVAFVEGDTDRVTGEEIGPRLFELGLTNTPFIDDLSPITPDWI